MGIILITKSKILAQIFDIILNSDFTSLPESSLVSLLKRDDLQMKEKFKFGATLSSGGIAQNSILSTNPEDWTFSQQCLPHILLVKELPRINEQKEPDSTNISKDHAAETFS
ncbi:hypothetical protein Glove_132g35 [Diversispora epigaea]|uniref:Uncharacterized protein n=1 Tax=Diversispora epigaea TaxID=1348612 RepID=A0A397J199_9GLOM|nr:hypothetical protein Glove_132g35 [Diversispora epigaea]